MMGKCKDCKYGKRFKDNFTGKVRYSCSINQYTTDAFGDKWLIIDEGCEKFSDKLRRKL